MKIYNILHNLPRHTRDSLKCAAFLTSFIVTVTSFLGHSLKDIEPNLYYRISILVIMLILLFIISRLLIWLISRKAVDIQIRNTSIKICYGDIFSKDDFSGQVLRVIGCDSHFNTQVDDTVIAKKSLHGQLVLEHGEEKDQKTVTESRSIGIYTHHDIKFVSFRCLKHKSLFATIVYCIQPLARFQLIRFHHILHRS